MHLKIIGSENEYQERKDKKYIYYDNRWKKRFKMIKKDQFDSYSRSMGSNDKEAAKSDSRSWNLIGSNEPTVSFEIKFLINKIAQNVFAVESDLRGGF